MKHPFDLDSSDLEALDLDFKEQLTEEETARVGGGNNPYPLPSHLPSPSPLPFPKPSPSPYPPQATTLAVGEEGGGEDPIYTQAMWENG